MLNNDDKDVVDRSLKCCIFVLVLEVILNRKVARTRILPGDIVILIDVASLNKS